MRSSFWCSTKCSGASLQCCWVCGFHFCVCNWKTLPRAWEKHQCCYRNGLQALPIQSASFRMRSPSARWGSGRLSRRCGRWTLVFVLGKARLQPAAWLIKHVYDGHAAEPAGAWGCREQKPLGCTPGAPLQAPRDLPCKGRLLGFSPSRLLTPPSSVSLIFFSSPKTGRIHIQVDSLSLFFLFKENASYHYFLELSLTVQCNWVTAACGFQASHMYVHLFLVFKFFPRLRYYRISSRAPCAAQQVPVAHLFYIYLLLSRFSRVRPCATPETAAHQAPPSLGLSRQEHWRGLPFPSPLWIVVCIY